MASEIGVGVRSDLRPGDVPGDARFYGSAEKIEQRLRQIAPNSGTPLTDRQVRQAVAAIQRGDSGFGQVRRNIGYDPANPGGSSGGGGGGQPSQPAPPPGAGGVPPLPATPTVDFYALAARMYPWIPESLIRAYADGLAESGGNPEVGLGRMREHPEYDVHFAGNRRTDGPGKGTFRYSEADYVAVIDGYRQNFAARGVNPEIFAGKEHRWIEGDVSVAEHNAVIDDWDTYLRSWGPEGTNGYSYATQWFAEQWGLTDVTPEAALVALMDPEIGTEVARGRIKVAQIGGAAAAYGFKRTLSDAERLRGFGLGGDQAMELYSTAARRLPGMDAMARRHYDPRGGVGVDVFEGAFAAQDAESQRRLGRNLQAEQSSFSRRGVAREDQEGRAVGLRPS